MISRHKEYKRSSNFTIRLEKLCIVGYLKVTQFSKDQNKLWKKLMKGQAQLASLRKLERQMVQIHSSIPSSEPSNLHCKISIRSFSRRLRVSQIFKGKAKSAQEISDLSPYRYTDAKLLCVAQVWRLNFFLVHRSILIKEEIWRTVPLQRNLIDRNKIFKGMRLR